MTRAVLPLYGGAIRANKIGSFVMGGETFHLIRPGYCIQGKRRANWTQVVHEDIPVFTTRMSKTGPETVEVFERRWEKSIADDLTLLHRALDACKNEHRRKFRDGSAGEAPAPALTRVGRGEGHRYIT